VFSFRINLGSSCVLVFGEGTQALFHTATPICINFTVTRNSTVLRTVFLLHKLDINVIAESPGPSGDTRMNKR
jgi:hypothetical protein